MSEPEASRFIRSISDNECNDDAGSLRLNPNSKRRVHSIAVNPSAALSAERMSLAGIPEGINEFFTDDDGQSFLEGIEHPAALNPAETFASPLYSHRPYSTPSINTVIFCGVWNMSVSQLCDVIKQHRSLRRAEILSTQCYTEFNGRVVHRFLIMELRREGRKGIWLGLDRRPGRSTWQLLRAVGKAPAKDTAQLAVVRQDLIGCVSLENRQVFETAPTLGELQYFLSVVCDELTVYKAWPENCYFYCSLIQEHLGAEGKGTFSKGELPYADLAQEIRGRVQERVRLFYHMPAPLTLSSLTSLSEIGLQCDDALVLSRQWDSLKSTGYVGSHKLADKLERALRPVGETLLSTSRIVESVALSQLTRGLWRSLDHKGERTNVSSQYHDDSLQETQQFNSANEIGTESVHISPYSHGRGREEYCKGLSRSLCTYGISLRRARQFDDACKAAAEAVALSRHLYERDREQYCEHLSNILYEYEYSLREAQRFDDACKVGTENVALSRHLYDGDPNQYRKGLARSLCLYDVSLQEAKRFNEACEAGAEGVSLSRHLYDRDPNQYRGELARSLCWYGISLREAKRFNEACEAGAEGVSLSRHLYDRDQSRYHEGLALSLSHHCLSLRKAKRFSEACQASAEGVVLSRCLYDRDPNQYGEGLARSLHQYGISLQNDGQSNSACEVVTEAVVLIGRLYDRDPDQYRHKLALALCHYDNTLREADRSEDARALSRRHFGLFRQLYHAGGALDSGVAEYIHERYGTPPQWEEDRRD